MDIIDIFSPESDTIDITGLDSLIELSHYQSNRQESFYSGLILADLLTDKGVTLYTNGTLITPDKIARLLTIQAGNPKREMNFKIKRSGQLMEKFKLELLKRVGNQLSFRTKYKVYSNLLAANNEKILTFFNEFFSDEAIVLAAYKMVYIIETCPKKSAALFLNHAISVASLSYALALSPQIQEENSLEQDDYNDLVMVALFHSMGSIISVNDLLREDPKLLPRLYRKANLKSHEYLTGITLNNNSALGLKYINEFHCDKGDKEFLQKSNDTASLIENIIIFIDHYVLHKSGLFEEQSKISRIIDDINILALQNKINTVVVKALTLALHYNHIFDFYEVIDTLQKMCTFQGGNHARPYPMTGFKSPTLFLCKDHCNDCEHYEASLKAVSIVRKNEEFQEGKYSRCILTTAELLQFYKGHYSEIKEVTLDAQSDKDTTQIKKPH